MSDKRFLGKEMLKKVEEMGALFDFMLKDLQVSNLLLGMQLVEAEKTHDLFFVESIIRMRVRAVVSFLESTCFYFRHISRGLCELTKRDLPKEYIIEEGQRTEVKDKIKLSLRFLPYSLGKKVELDLASRRWQNVCNLIDKRHLITHPTAISDLQVDVKDLENVNDAMLWLTSYFYRVTGRPIPKDLESLF